MAVSMPGAGTDVTVIGGGLAGKAAALLLARAGLKVVCISPKESNRSPVGESLDWSAPELLRGLGFTMEGLVASGTATWKRHVTVKTTDGRQETYEPAPWLAQAPFRVELRTLHLDRERFDEELRRITLASGVEMVSDRGVKVQTSGKRVTGIDTASGASFSSRWYIDATGFSASLLAREFALPVIADGPAKVAIWTYFTAPESVEGTTLYMDSRPSEYLEWIWEIPIRPGVVSVGYALSGTAMKKKRGDGASVEEIFQSQLRKFPRFAPLLAAGPISDNLNVTSFQSRLHRETAGPNWLMVGEAASMVDPMTANGVTAALRHAAEASRLIVKYRHKHELPQLARATYSRRITSLGRFFNDGIEKIVYRAPVRTRQGMQSAGEIYTTPAWTMNWLYSRLAPRGAFGTALFGCGVAFLRACAVTFYLLCKRGTQANGAAA